MRGQVPDSGQQAQEGFEPDSHPFRIDVAQPTPGLTVIAFPGQFIAQAPHSMQASRSMIRAFPSGTENTPCGQTFAHMPHPVQEASANRTVATPSRYRNPFIPILLPPERQPASAPVIQKTMADAARAAWTGMARRISFSTPEGDVNGVAPVKFMATNDETAGSAERMANV